MFRFEHTPYFWALLLIPILTFFFVAMRKRRKAALLRFGESGLTARLMPLVSHIKHQFKFGILMFVLLLLVVAWANPQWGIRKEKVKKKSADVMVALDISNSMLANDVAPNRLERSKAFALDLVKAIKSESVGTIVFAGNAYLQMPLTTDYTAAALFLQSANPDQAPTQGTALADAITTAEKAFENDAKNHKILILISDGEDHEGEAIIKAKRAPEKGIIIFTIGAGTTEGSTIPYNFGGVEEVKRDEKGEPVRTKLNESILKEIAQAGGGEYFNIANTNGIIAALQSRIEKVEKREIEQRVFNEYDTYFQYFVFFALLLLFFEFMLPYRRSEWLEGRDIFKV